MGTHDRFRYSLIGAAFCVSFFVFIRMPKNITPPFHIPLFDPLWIMTTFTLPAAALVIVLIFKSLAKRDPLRKNYHRFCRTYEILLDLAVLLTVAMHLIWIVKMLVWRGAVGLFWLSYVPTSVLGLILIIVGNILPRLRPNGTMGIRTRWTLRDESVWMKTHRAGGYFLLVFGLTLLAWTFIDFMGIWWVLGPGLILAASGLPALSYFFWKRGRRVSARETPA